MKKNVKRILLGLAILVAVGGGLYYAMMPTPVALTQVIPGTAELSFTEQGLYAAGNILTVYPLVQGRLLEVSVAEGQSVRAGDVLCVVDPEPMQQGIERIRGSIRGYEAQVGAAESQQRSSNAGIGEQTRLQTILIAQNRRNLEVAQEDLARAELLYEAGALAKIDVDNLSALVAQYASALEANEQQLAVIAAGAGASGLADYYRALIEAEEISIAQLEKDIENCHVRTPVSGVVTGLYAKGTNYITAGAPVAVITVLEGGAIEVYVSTRDVSSVRPGDQVALTLKRREGNLEFAGRVDQVESNAEIRLSALGLEERRVKVRVTPDPASAADITLGAGYDVDVRFIVYREENKLTIPKTALFQDDGSDMVWVIRDGKALPVPVVKGMELRTSYVIESGLTAGEAVVTDANNEALKNGLKVTEAG
ncbi:MAG: HlyD family efflux transporter periplasmic adaptor subunit [Clostridiales bacterium]|nr:HlyD family efflux transporter periplasmic adaptor subunit [Clostridiales bacterium]